MTSPEPEQKLQCSETNIKQYMFQMNILRTGGLMIREYMYVFNCNVIQNSVASRKNQSIEMVIEIYFRLDHHLHCIHLYTYNQLCDQY